jgi:hypothetical protein
LTDAIFALDEAVAALGKTAGTGSDWTPAAPAIDAFEQAVKALWRWNNKLAVRVGDQSDVHSAYSDATYAAQRAMFVVSSVKERHSAPPLNVSSRTRFASRLFTHRLVSTMLPRRLSGSSVSVASGRARRPGEDIRAGGLVE